ncbi:MAG: N-6 DNA methylase [Saprospiraceae bacterium]
MPRVLSEARSMCPELVDAFKEMDALAYMSRYDTVFSDFINWLVYQHQFPLANKNPIEKYTKEEQGRFLKIYQSVQREVRKRTTLWVKDKNLSPRFYDPLGRMYETITSKYKSSMLGQYFTPEYVVDMMTQINGIGNKRNEFVRVFDPACGSGRMGLSAAAYGMSKGNPTWVTMNDIDPICTKMTAVNMALNGVVGEAVCMNGLDLTDKSFRFAYKISPLYLYLSKATRDLHRIAIMSKTRQDIKKQYVLIPLKYDQTYLSLVNKNLVKELAAAQKIREEKERNKAIEKVENELKARLKGSLFEEDETLLKNIKLPLEEKKKHSKKNKLNKSNPKSQGSLFGNQDE